ncbi:MAG: GntR family transcriptional regulator [Rhizobiaceae bacterium]
MGEGKGSGTRRGALQVYDALREDILWLRIKPGTALDEVGLAARFKVSRTPIREALLLLSGENFVQFLPNRTTIAAPFQLDNLGDYLDTFLILSRGAVRSAAMCGKADPSELNSFLTDYEKAIGEQRFHDALRADNAFRRHLAGLSGNIFQTRFFDQILDAGVRSKVLHYFPNATADDLSASVNALSRLAESVTAGNPDESDERVTEIINAEYRIVARALDPKVAHDVRMSGHPVGLEELK